MKVTYNLRVKEYISLISPGALKEELTMGSEKTDTVLSGRDKIENILQKKDSRLLVILGPCSIHDEDAALEFAERFILLRKKVEETLFIVIKLLL